MVVYGDIAIKDQAFGGRKGIRQGLYILSSARPKQVSIFIVISLHKEMAVIPLWNVWLVLR
jgi:hypothetical protein